MPEEILDKLSEALSRIDRPGSFCVAGDVPIVLPGLDPDTELDRRGSPQTLVCTKNKASYQRKLKTYHQEQEYLATVRSIEASLPTK